MNQQSAKRFEWVRGFAWLQIIMQVLISLIPSFSYSAFAQTSSEYRLSPFSSDRPASLAEGPSTDLPYAASMTSMATALSGSNAAGMATSAATGYASSSAEKWLSQFGTARVNLSVDDNGRWDQSSLDLLIPLYDNRQSVWFTQFGLRAPDNRVTGNLGTGVRTYYLQDWMFGANVFFDNDFTGNNRRVGIGGEAWTNYLKLSANSYVGTSSWHDSRDFDNYQEKPADGFDLRAEGYLPAYPQLGAKVMYEQYYGEKVALFDKDTLQRNPSAITTGLSYTPVPLVTLGVDYRQGQNAQSEANFQLSVRYDIGQNWRAQLDPDNVRALRTLAGSRYDLVERNNQIVLQYRRKPDQGVSNLTLTALTDNAPADGLTQNTVQVLATNRDNEPVRNAPVTWSTSGSARFATQTAVTNGDGLATALLTNTTPEAVQVTASSGSATASLASHFIEVKVSHVALTLTKDNSIADGKTANAALATVTDINNRPVANSKVTWSAGAPVTLLNPQGVTDSNGQVRTQLTATAPGAFPLNITAGEVSAAQTTHFTVNAAAAQITGFSMLTNNSPANGTTQNVALVTVRDPAGNSVSGVNVTVSADKGTVAFASAAARATAQQTDGNGQLRVAFTDTVAESVTLTAKLDNGSSKTVASVFGQDPDSARVSALITTTGAVANGNAINQATVTVVDAKNSPISGVDVTWAQDGSAVFGASAKTDASGQTTVTFTDVKAQTVNITASVNGAGLSKPSTFIADTATAKIESVTIIKDKSPADGTTQNSATAVVSDANGNPLSNETVSWSADKSTVTLVPGGSTDSTGKTAVSFTDTTAETLQLNASLSNGSSLSQTSEFVVDVAGLKITQFYAASAADIHDTTVLRLFVQDKFNKPVNGANVKLSVSGSAQLETTSGVTSYTTIGNGTLLVNITDAVVETVTATATLDNNVSATAPVQFVQSNATAITVTLIQDGKGIDAPNTAVAKAVDKNGYPVPGYEIRWSLGSTYTSQFNFTPISDVTDANGEVRTSVQSKSSSFTPRTLTLEAIGTTYAFNNPTGSTQMVVARGN